VSFSFRGESALTGLRALAAHFRRGVLGGGHAAVQLIVKRAQTGIRSGPHTGAVYTTYFRTNTLTGNVFPVGSRPAHQAGAPGEYSANDTGDLAGSIGGSNSVFQMRVFATSPHAGYQEFGTSKMGARPNVQNAIRDTLPQVEQVLGQWIWREIA